jgi:hypothetical protein
MTDRKALSILLKGFLFIVLVLIAAITVVASIGWWSGWTTLNEFKRGIQLLGALLIGLGLLLIGFNLAQGRGTDDRTNMPAERGGNQNGTRQNLIQLASTYAVTIVLGFAGLVCLVIGWLL